MTDFLDFRFQSLADQAVEHPFPKLPLSDLYRRPFQSPRSLRGLDESVLPLSGRLPLGRPALHIASLFGLVFGVKLGRVHAGRDRPFLIAPFGLLMSLRLRWCLEGTKTGFQRLFRAFAADRAGLDHRPAPVRHDQTIAALAELQAVLVHGFVQFIPGLCGFDPRQAFAPYPPDEAFDAGGVFHVGSLDLASRFVRGVVVTLQTVFKLEPGA